MADKEKLIKEKVDYSGIFDFKALYSFAHSWLDEEEEYGVTEEKYSEKVSGNARDITVVWDATKQMSDYFKVQIGVEFQVKELVDVEVEVDGKKKKMNKGKVTVELKGTLIRDPDSKWDSTPSYRFLRQVYDKYVIPGTIESMRGKLIADIQNLKEELKAFLELYGRR